MCFSCYETSAVASAPGAAAWRPPDVGALAGTEALSAYEATVRELVGSSVSTER